VLTSESCLLTSAISSSEPFEKMALYFFYALQSKDILSVTCIFCDLIRGSRPFSIVAVNDHCVAFLDEAPFAPGHTLIIPRQHCSELPLLDDTIWASMMHLGAQIAARLRGSELYDGITCTGTTLYMADGEGAQPHVPHLHLHVIPRHAQDAERWIRWLAELPEPL
jgi:histidine triad (HIT) family protein